MSKRIISTQFQGIVPVLLVLIAVALLYSPSLGGSWHYDDFHHISENPHIRTLDNVPRFFYDPGTFSRIPNTRMYRPVLMVSYALNYQVARLFSGSGTNILWYHIGNVGTHLAVILTVYLLLLALLKVNNNTPAKTPYAVAALSALLFGIHPVNTEAVVYISSRSSLLATLFTALSVLTYLKARESRRFQALLIILSLMLFAAGILSKEIAIVLPGIIIAFHLTFPSARFERSGVFSFFSVFSIYGVTAGFFLFLRYLVLAENLPEILISRGGTQATHDLTAQIATQLRVWSTYAREILWPVGLNLDKRYRISPNLLDSQAIFSLLLISTVLIICYHFRHRISLPALGMFWMCLALLPTSVIRLNVILSDHRLYLPMVGFSLIIAFVLTPLVEAVYSRTSATSFQKSVCAAVLVFFSFLLMGAITAKRISVFQTEKTLWSDVLKNNPDSFQGNLNLGISAWENWELEKAKNLLELAKKLKPDSHMPLVALGALYYDMGNTGMAFDELNEAIRLAPWEPNVTANLARLHRLTGNRRKALDLYNQTLELQPFHREALIDLGRLLREEGDLEGSQRKFELASDLYPTDTKVAFEAAKTFMRLGMTELALAKLDQYLASSSNKDPDYLEGLRYRGILTSSTRP